MGEEVRKHFAKTVDDYDTVCGKVVMNNDEIHDNIVNSIPFQSMDRISILDLGCGTGHGAFLILDTFVNANLIGVDFSDRMISKCVDKLKDFNDRFQLIEEDFTNFFPAVSFDAVVSAIAIHNTTHKQKAELFEKIFRSLKPGGAFINGDFVYGESEEMNSAYMSSYRAHLSNNLGGEELEAWLNHAFMDDKPMKLSHQFDLLKNTGFRSVELVWQKGREAVYIARK